MPPTLRFWGLLQGSSLRCFPLCARLSQSVSQFVCAALFKSFHKLFTRRLQGFYKTFTRLLRGLHRVFSDFTRRLQNRIPRTARVLIIVISCRVQSCYIMFSNAGAWPSQAFLQWFLHDLYKVFGKVGYKVFYKVLTRCLTRNVYNVITMCSKVFLQGVCKVFRNKVYKVSTRLWRGFYKVLTRFLQHVHKAFASFFCHRVFRVLSQTIYNAFTRRSECF